MDAALRKHLDATFFVEYQALRDQLMAVISDADLARDLGVGTLTLGGLCREIGEVEQAYIDSFRTFRRDFSYRYPDSAIERDRGALITWFRRLDADLLSTLEGLSAEDVRNRRMDGADFDPGEFSPLPTVQLDIYREALLIFYAKASVYPGLRHPIAGGLAVLDRLTAQLTAARSRPYSPLYRMPSALLNRLSMLM